MSFKLKGTLRRNSTKSIKVTVRCSNRKVLKGAKIRAAGAGVSKSKTTNTRGTATFRLRPTKAGSVTFTITKSGYGDETKTVRVR